MLAIQLLKNHTQFRMKILWLKCDCYLPIHPQFSLAFSQAILNDPLAAGKRVRELGYEALLLGFYDSKQSGESLEQRDIKPWIALWKETGIKLGFKPHLSPNSLGCPLDPNYQNRMEKGLLDFLNRFPSTDFIFWESNLLSPAFDAHTLACDATKLDLIWEEIQLLERLLKKNYKLLFYIPAQVPEWFSALSHLVGSNTTLVFSALEGCPWDDHLPLHPYWSHLCPLSDVLPMPMMNLGSGKWLNIPLDLLERCRGYKVDGPLVLAPHLPGYGGALECSLWLGSQLTLPHFSVELFAQKWLAKQRPDLSFEEWQKLVKTVRRIATEIQSCHHSKELYRLKIEHLWGEIKYEKLRLEIKKERSEGSPSLADYFFAFAQDMRTILYDVSRKWNIPLLGIDQKKIEFDWQSPVGKKILSENLFQKKE